MSVEMRTVFASGDFSPMPNAVLGNGARGVAVSVVGALGSGSPGGWAVSDSPSNALNWFKVSSRLSNNSGDIAVSWRFIAENVVSRDWQILSMDS